MDLISASGEPVMDAFVQLALIEKAKQVFARDPALMLAFPLLSPVSFTAEELAALAAPADAAGYAAAADFARIVNFVPQDMVASASERMLWDVYLDVLRRAEVARGSGDIGRADPASAILYDYAPDGTRSDSEALRRYREYRDAWFVARENYAQHKLTGELSEDPAIRQAWTQTEEPVLRAEVDAAAQAWEGAGQRTAIELALKAERDSALKSPELLWAEWQGAFNPDIDMIPDAGGNLYAPTGLSPRNFAEQEDWLDFDLTAGEMRALVDAAPPELKTVLDDDGPGDIERVSFQYRSVALVRPWFQPEVLSSGIWRSSDPALLLSDGANPPHGACPAYVSACVFVRNVEEVKKQPTGGGSGGSQIFDHLDIGAIGAERLVRREVKVDPKIFATVARRRQLVSPPPPLPRVEAVQVRAFRRLGSSGFKLADALPVGGGAAPATLGKRRRWFTRRRGLDVTHEWSPGIAVTDVIGVATATPTPTPPAPPDPPREEISVLAYICKRLPKVPDPAPGLRWT